MSIKLEKDLAELIGIMFGDGCLSRTGGKYIIYISGHKKDDYLYHSQFIVPLFKRTFNKEVNVQFRKGENTLFIRFSDKSIFYELKDLGLPVGRKYDYLKIPLFIIHTPILFKRFIRGLFDTDGSVIFSKQHRTNHYYPRLEIASHSKSFLDETLKILKANGFYGSVSNKNKGNYRLEIPGFKNLKKWKEEIGFSNVKHLKRLNNFSYNAP
jgi:DNA-binding transcriptional regulator WhiA